MHKITVRDLVLCYLSCIGILMALPAESIIGRACDLQRFVRQLRYRGRILEVKLTGWKVQIEFGQMFAHFNNIKL